MEIDKVYFEDARKMSEVDNESITLIVTSPPYWNIKDYSLDGYQRERIYSKIEGQIGNIHNYGYYIE